MAGAMALRAVQGRNKTQVDRQGPDSNEFAFIFQVIGAILENMKEDREL